MSEENKKYAKMETRRESRNHVFNIIFQSEFHDLNELEQATKQYYEILDDEALEEEKINPNFCRPTLDKAFIESELNGIRKNLEQIDNIINEYCVGWSVSRISKIDLAILRLAVYEIMFRDDIPDGVCVNEAVELAKKYSHSKSPSFINGVLGNILNNK